MNTRRAAIILVSLLTTFIVVRASLSMSPNSDFNVMGYNIHHLFTGLLLITVGGIPLALFPGNSRILDAMAVLFGAGLSLALDEWIYLIVTDGTNASYLLPVSLKGGTVMIVLAAAYVAILYILSKDKQPPSNP
jgi:hypothetical protein